MSLGQWELALPHTEEVRVLFTEKEVCIEDTLDGHGSWPGGVTLDRIRLSV